MKMNHYMFVSICLVGSCLLSAEAQAKGCQSDSDCKGDRICVDGFCIDPPIRTTQCKRDVDCPGSEVCSDKHICSSIKSNAINGSPKTPTEASTQPPTGTPPTQASFTPGLALEANLFLSGATLGSSASTDRKGFYGLSGEFMFGYRFQPSVAVEALVGYAGYWGDASFTTTWLGVAVPFYFGPDQKFGMHLEGGPSWLKADKGDSVGGYTLGTDVFWQLTSEGGGLAAGFKYSQWNEVNLLQVGVGLAARFR